MKPRPLQTDIDAHPLIYLTSLPTVMLAIIFFTASFFLSFFSLLRSFLSSASSPTKLPNHTDYKLTDPGSHQRLQLTLLCGGKILWIRHFSAPNLDSKDKTGLQLLRIRSWLWRHQLITRTKYWKMGAWLVVCKHAADKVRILNWLYPGKLIST